MEAVLLCEKEKCLLLSSVGINVNLAPVCDITTDPSAFLYDRSLGQSPEITSEFIRDTVLEMNSNKIGSCLKHFPGYGNNADTHVGMAVDHRSLEELENRDLLPFAAGIQAGADAILVSHTIVEALDPVLPASLSPAVHDYLRNTMGFQGVIVTDDLVMQAITDTYGAGEAAVLAVLAGNDLLCSTEYTLQYEAVLTAVLEGRISIDVLNDAVRNVLEWKIELGLI
jgi:beta-N-acetylhexosaminidase